MGKLEDAVEKLFADYGRRFDAALRDPAQEDTEAVAAAFAPYFVGSTPQGVFGAPNDDGLRAAIPQGFARYRAVGGRRMVIDAVTVTAIDALHAMAAVDWAFDYETAARESGVIRFRNFYFVTMASGEPLIFAYVTPDEEAALREHGLV